MWKSDATSNKLHNDGHSKTIIIPVTSSQRLSKAAVSVPTPTNLHMIPTAPSYPKGRT